MKQTGWLSIVVILFCFSSGANGQYLAINTSRIQSLIEQWNEAHNQRNIAPLENVFADEVLFYTERVPRSQATLLKKLLFVRNPGYQQHISSDINYILHSTGIIKCEFSVDKLKQSGKESATVYLLVGFRKHKYWVIGESDYETDRRHLFTPDIGEPEKMEMVQASIRSTSNVAMSTTVMRSVVASPANDSRFLRGFNVPLYLILGLISMALILIVRDQWEQKKDAKKNEPLPGDNPDSGPAAFGQLTEVTLPEQSYQMVEYCLKQNSFKGYLQRWFDPLYFTIESSQTKRFPSPRFGECINPAMSVLFSDEASTPVKLSIQCIYREDTGREITLLGDEFNHSDNSLSETQRYYAIGVGGPPNSPDHLFLLPALDVTSLVISKETLQLHRKSGLFFYDRKSARLV